MSDETYHFGDEIKKLKREREEVEKDEWRNLTLPLNLFDRLAIQLARVLRANGEVPEKLFSEDKKVRTAARVDATEFLVLLCERTDDEKVFRV